MIRRLKTPVLAGLTLILFASMLPAGGVSQCLYDCETSLCADFGNHSEFCRQTRANCEAHCSRADAFQAWGAIAYSQKDKAYGTAYNADTKQEATTRAMANCAKRGSGCVVWISFNRECGAIAIDGAHTGWGTANARYYAKERALQECAKNGGQHCEILDSVCSQ